MTSTPSEENALRMRVAAELDVLQKKITQEWNDDPTNTLEQLFGVRDDIRRLYYMLSNEEPPATTGDTDDSKMTSTEDVIQDPSSANSNVLRFDQANRQQSTEADIEKLLSTEFPLTWRAVTEHVPDALEYVADVFDKNNIEITADRIFSVLFAHLTGLLKGFHQGTRQRVFEIWTEIKLSAINENVSFAHLQVIEKHKPTQE